MYWHYACRHSQFVFKLRWDTFSENIPPCTCSNIFPGLLSVRPGNPGMYLIFAMIISRLEVIENERKSWKTPGKMKGLTKPLYLQKITQLSHVINSVLQAFPSLFLRNLEIQQLLYMYMYRTIKCSKWAEELLRKLCKLKNFWIVLEKYLITFCV